MSHIKLTVPSDYLPALEDLKNRINQTRYNSLKAINTELINLYWDIGKLVSEKSADGWGSGVVNKLSFDLQLEFVGVAGFSRSNIFRMKQFYEIYNSNEKLAQVVRQLAWGQNIELLSNN